MQVWENNNFKTYTSKLGARDLSKMIYKLWI